MVGKRAPLPNVRMLEGGWPDEYRTALPRYEWRITEDERTIQLVRRAVEVYVPPGGLFVVKDVVCLRCRHEHPGSGGDPAAGAYTAAAPCIAPDCRCKAPVITYNPLEHGEALFTEATCIDPSDARVLLRFVNRWGILGLGLRREAGGPRWHGDFEAVEETQLALRVFRQIADQLYALKQHDWRSPALPSDADLKAMTEQWRGKMSEAHRRELGLASDDARSAPIPTRVRPKLHAIAFANKLNTYLATRQIQFVAAPEALSNGGVRLVPAYRPVRLIDVLYVILWSKATGRDTTLRRCGACNGLFEVRVTNERKQWCGDTCKKRAQRARQPRGERGVQNKHGVSRRRRASR